jgi:hypothetical protein
MNTKLLRLGSEEKAAFTDKINVPGASGVDTSGKGGCALDIANTLGSIWES